MKLRKETTKLALDVQIKLDVVELLTMTFLRGSNVKRVTTNLGECLYNCAAYCQYLFGQARSGSRWKPIRYFLWGGARGLPDDQRRSTGVTVKQREARNRCKCLRFLVFSWVNFQLKRVACCAPVVNNSFPVRVLGFLGRRVHL